MLAALIFLAGDHNFTQWLCFDMFLSVPMEAELYFLIYCCVVLYNQCSPDCLCCFFSLTLSSDKCLDRENKVNRSCYQICLCYPVIALYLFTPIYLSILYLQAYWISYSIFIDDSRLKICVCFLRLITICFMFRQAFQISSRVGSMRLIKTEKVCY